MHNAQGGCWGLGSWSCRVVLQVNAGWQGLSAEGAPNPIEWYRVPPRAELDWRLADEWGHFGFRVTVPKAEFGL